MISIKLYIFRKGGRTYEVLGLPDDRQVSLPPFGLINCLLGGIRRNEYRAMLVEQDRAAVQEVLSHFVGCFGLPLRETPVTFFGGAFSQFKPPWLAFAFELCLLQLAGILWLLPGPRWRREKPSEQYARIYQKLPSPLDLDTALAYTMVDLIAKAAAYYESGGRRVGESDFWADAKKDPNLPADIHEHIRLLEHLGRVMLLEAIEQRQAQLAVRFVGHEIERITKKVTRQTADYTYTAERYVPARCYISQTGLLPLCWAEVLYAVESDTFARTCDVCRNWFPLQKTQVGQQKYCSSSCLAEAKRRAIAKKREGEAKRLNNKRP